MFIHVSTTQLCDVYYAYVDLCIVQDMKHVSECKSKKERARE